MIPPVPVKKEKTRPQLINRNINKILVASTFSPFISIPAIHNTPPKKLLMTDRPSHLGGPKYAVIRAIAMTIKNEKISIISSAIITPACQRPKNDSLPPPRLKLYFKHPFRLFSE
jgi:hypothetical protein